MTNTPGIILSITIIAGLAAAATQNPQIQAWLEEQRKKIAELLRQIGEELDPASRRAAEAFAYEGRTTANDEGLAREAEGSQQAAALATGRRLSSPSTIRRIPVRGPSDPDEAEERRRKGREYLARRNQQLYELQQKRKAAAKADGLETPPTPTFDELVDSEGNLKRSEMFNEKDLPAVPSTEPIPEAVQEEMKQVERNLYEPIPQEESAASSGWSAGSRYANPFGDEYELERSVTPKPPVPPKISLDTTSEAVRAPTPPISVPGAFESTPRADTSDQVDPDLSYEEQMAIALSLSEQDSATPSATVRRRSSMEEDAELKAAIAASLREMDDQQAAHAVANAEPVTPKATPADSQALIDVTESEALQPNARGFGHTWQFSVQDWMQQGNRAATSSLAMSDTEQRATSFSPSTYPASSNLAPSEASDDELYRLTPELTKARLANHTAQQRSSIASSSTVSPLPFDPVRDAAAAAPQPIPDTLESSFYSAHASQSPAPSSVTLDRETPMLVDYSEDAAPQEGQRTPTHSSFGFQTDMDSDTDTFASVTAPPSRAESRLSDIEVIDLVEDSDVDMLSEEGDGVATPDSWSEVGSRDAEDSDMEEPVRT